MSAEVIMASKRRNPADRTKLAEIMLRPGLVRELINNLRLTAKPEATNFGCAMVIRENLVPAR